MAEAAEGHVETSQTSAMLRETMRNITQAIGATADGGPTALAALQPPDAAERARRLQKGIGLGLSGRHKTAESYAAAAAAASVLRCAIDGALREVRLVWMHLLHTLHA